MKLRISDAIDCTCTAGGWSRVKLDDLDVRARACGEEGVDWERRVVDALPVKYRGKRQGERVNEWLPICSIPLLERLVPRVQIYPRLTALPTSPFWSPGHPCESYPCAHASHLSTMGGRFRSLFPTSPLLLLSIFSHLNTDVPSSVHVRTYFVFVLRFSLRSPLSTFFHSRVHVMRLSLQNYRHTGAVKRK